MTEAGAQAPAGSTVERPQVTVVMPFAGTAAEAREAIGRLGLLRLQVADRLVLVDNTPDGVAVRLAPELSDRAEIVPATGERSSYHARNTGARVVGDNDWLLFIDSDCVPDRELLDAYFDPAPSAGDGMLVGEIDGAPSQTALLARYSRSRGYLNQLKLVEDPFRPHAVTANVLVRRAAFNSIGGFAEGVRSGGDSDFCWRLQEAGWALDYRPQARVVHDHRESLRTFLRVAARYAAGRAWLRRRHPGAFGRRPGAAAAARSSASAARWLLGRRYEQAAFRALDAAVGAVDLVGEQLSNRPPPRSITAVEQRPAVIVIADAFPVQSETFITEEIRALVRAGHRVDIEAARRPVRQALLALGTAPTRYLEDDARLEKLRSGVWLLARHPLGCIRDLVDRRRWAAEERLVLPLRALAPLARRISAAPAAKLHCHFAASAALTTLRVSRLLGRQYALTAHAYEIYREPRNLKEKLGGAAIVFTGCEYNVEHLRSLLPASQRERVHEVVMGIDPNRYTRTSPLPDGRRVIAVGRLVEKKGFADLLRAAALMSATELDEIVIVGDGPLRSELESSIARLGLEERVRLVGAVEPNEVRELLEHADVFAMPAVIARDGDRDSMPVVVKEAMALELMIVATNEVGLPEIVRAPWGRLVEPRRPDQLAAALAEVLALSIDERAAAGRAARAHVLEHGSVEHESAKLAQLLGL